VANNPNDGFAGVISALNAVANLNGAEVQEYPNNWDGIIKAILNLGLLGDANLGEYPPGWEIITDEDGNPIGGDWVGQKPQNGDLWFDTRQGRLMVYIDDNYYQTNGADVLTVVGTTQPTSEVTGALWYNPDTTSLFIYDGTTWVIVGSGTTFISTSTLPLATLTTAETQTSNPQFTYVSKYIPATPNDYTQKTLNQWSIRALLELDLEAKRLAERNEIHVSADEPVGINGDLWANTTARDLRVKDNEQWIKTYDDSSLQASIANLIQQQTSDCATLNAEINGLQSQINQLPFSDYVTTTTYTPKIQSIEGSISELSTTIGDLNRFALNTVINPQISGLDGRVTVLENIPAPDLSPYITSAQVAIDLNALEQTIDSYDYASTSYVDTKISEIQIPDISGKLNTANFDAYVVNAGNTYYKKAGDKITGTMVMENMDITLPTLDFSSSFAAGAKAFSFKAKNATKVTTFGTSVTPGELAWTFEGNEDFCWKYGTNKVFSINKDGASTPALIVNGINVENKLSELEARPSAENPIDLSPLEEKISALQSDVSTLDIYNVSELEQKILDLQTKVNGGLCTNQIYYQDDAPSDVHDGDIWFNSCTLRLYVRHSNAWINPDRVVDDSPEPTSTVDPADITALQTQLQAVTSTIASLSGNDLNLKADLFNAVASSNSFLDLKTKLMAALSS